MLIAVPQHNQFFFSQWTFPLDLTSSLSIQMILNAACDDWGQVHVKGTRKTQPLCFVELHATVNEIVQQPTRSSSKWNLLLKDISSAQLLRTALLCLQGQQRNMRKTRFLRKTL
eukprot:TRINITY_DN5341_c0_g1_i2.p1 TRINITY_DN5341_c0_g1~~TRINITY_DN5341_c0_g1_i2.p1  ORF type:complete len:114 (+),score=11.11 TRINITY_DN5341_c0_g1_i2:229-570(+)